LPCNCLSVVSAEQSQEVASSRVWPATYLERREVLKNEQPTLRGVRFSRMSPWDGLRGGGGAAEEPE